MSFQMKKTVLTGRKQKTSLDWCGNRTRGKNESKGKGKDPRRHKDSWTWFIGGSMCNHFLSLCVQCLCLVVMLFVQWFLCWVVACLFVCHAGCLVYFLFDHPIGLLHVTTCSCYVWWLLVMGPLCTCFLSFVFLSFICQCSVVPFGYNLIVVFI